MRTELLLSLLFTVNTQGKDLVEDAIAAGFSMQSHRVTTEDGYILTMHRIPEGTSEVAQKPSILLMHGIMGTSADFINQGPNSNLGFILSNAGFDVWLGNARGNPYSRAHETLDPDKDSIEFFNFSWEEIAIFDIRAMVDYILSTTGESQTRFIGDTQGGTAFLILNLLKPEYNEKFQMAQLLDPVGYTKFFPSAELKAVATMINPLYNLAIGLGIGEISTLNLHKNFTDTGVTHQLAVQSIVSYIASLGGFTSIGTSLKNLAHYAQNIRDESFRRWDYGQNVNYQIYGTPSPPPYNLTHVTVYTMLYYRKNNKFIDKKDIEAMASDMPNARAIGISGTEFTHSNLEDIARTKGLR
ncbi:lipase 1-like [Cydia fagiglandana]|uniref:lipase 1-like n=1 Tax=Cydia fagiglandana TaxID=1458189 RepID=UPI002FEDF6AF